MEGDLVGINVFFEDDDVSVVDVVVVWWGFEGC